MTSDRCVDMENDNEKTSLRCPCEKRTFCLGVVLMGKCWFSHRRTPLLRLGLKYRPEIYFLDGEVNKICWFSLADDIILGVLGDIQWKFTETWLATMRKWLTFHYHEIWLGRVLPIWGTILEFCYPGPIWTKHWNVFYSNEKARKKCIPENICRQLARRNMERHLGGAVQLHYFWNT